MSPEALVLPEQQIVRTQTEQPAQESYLTTFTQTPVLRDFTKAFRDIPINWDRIADYIQETNHTKRLLQQTTSINGLLMEVHSHLAVENIAELYPSFRMHTFPSLVTDQYRFQTGVTGRNVVVTERESKRIIAEYDELLMIDGHPVVIEHTTTKDTGMISSKLKPDRMNTRIKPIMEAMQRSDIGYIMMALPHVVNFQSREQERFRKNGGIISTYSVSQQDLDWEATQFVEHKLR